MKDRVIKSLIFLLVIGTFSLDLTAQTSSQNYMKITTPKVPVYLPVDVDALPTNQKTEVINYFDGFGRTVQSIQRKFSPTNKDLIQFFEYNLDGYVETDYLPYTINSNSNYRNNPATEQMSFYGNTSNIAVTTRPFTEFEFDGSPLHSVEKIYPAGDAWQPGGGHDISTQRIDEINPIYHFALTPSGNITLGYYPNSAIETTQTVDEDNHRVRIFKTSDGRTISIWKDVDGTPLKTYYVYDELGRAAKVIQPQGIREFELGDFNVGINPDFIFSYEYDKYNRIVIKDIPGKDKSYFVYNQTGDIVLTQDGNQRGDRKWTFYKYDRQGRMVMQGEYSHGIAVTQSQMQALFDNQTYFYERRSGLLNLNGVVGYTNRVFPTNNTEVFLVNQYDDYDWTCTNSIEPRVLDNLEDENYQPIYMPEYDQAIPNSLTLKMDRTPKGQITRTLKRVLSPTSSNRFLSEVYFYNLKGDVVKTLAEDYRLQNIEDETFTTSEHYYNWFGELLAENIIHAANSPDEVLLQKKYLYDNASRLQHLFYQVNKDSPVLLKQNRYNELGQLIEKNVHSFIAGKFLQSVDFKYNTRGWVTHINDIWDTATDYEDGISFDTHEIVTNLQLEHIRVTVTQETERNGTVHNILQFDNLKIIDVLDGGSQYANTTTTRGKLDDISLRDINILESNPLVINFDGVTLSYGFDIQDIISEAVTNATTQLNQLGVSQDGITFLINNLEGFIFHTLDGLYYNNTIKDLWAQRIRYNDKTTAITNSPGYYSGNISEVHWKNALSDRVEGYAHEYDDYGRLTESIYKEKASGSSVFNIENNRYTLKNVAYDFNGNISHLERQGSLNGVPDLNYGLVDKLDYSYDGNRLEKVNDMVLPEGINDFKENMSIPAGVNHYEYDYNGNTIEDKNKRLTIHYNFLNLPSEVVNAAGGSISFIYDATGKLLEKQVHQTGNADIVTTFENDFTYESDKLAYLAQPEGRIVPIDPIGFGGNPPYFRYEYHYQDYLGNNRLRYSDLDFDGTIDPDNEILEIMDYYPFGLEHKSSSDFLVGSVDPRKYNDKLLVSDLDLNWYNYGARYYNPELGRFGSVDPLAEEMPAWSPYSFSFNNPIFFIDPDGMKPTPSQAASMAWHIYDGKVGQVVDGWTLSNLYLDDKNPGYKAGLYTREVDGVMEYTMVNMGTIPGTGKENRNSMWDNVEQPFGASEHMKLSIRTAERLSEELGANADLTFVGHSKGGAEAAANAVATNRDAYVFNPTVVNLKGYGLNSKDYSANMTAFVVKGDPVAKTYPLFWAKPIDKLIMLPRQSWTNPIENHNNFGEALRQYLENNTIQD